MKPLRQVLLAAFFFGCFLVSSVSRAVTYKATVLNSLGGFETGLAYGVSGNSQVGVGSADTILSDAILWNAAAGTFTDLHPAGFEASVAYAIDGDTQVGRGFGPATGNRDHAVLWHGTASSAVDLHPVGFASSYAYGVSGDTQVGYGAIDVNLLFHALLWNGTAASAVDLSPVGFGECFALGVSGDHQTGYGIIAGSHALLWSGTAASVVDLHPDGFVESVSQAISGDSQVGYGVSFETSYDHALLWHSTAASAVDLHPAGFDKSYGTGVAGATQVGWAQLTILASETAPRHTIDHAFVWNGSAASAVDLHPFLGDLSPAMVQSHALAVADNGTIVGYGTNAGGNFYAILWSPVPEPDAAATMCLGIIGITCCARVSHPALARDRRSPAAPTAPSP